MRISRAAITLAILTALGSSTVVPGHFCIEGGTLYLTPDGTALLRQDVSLSLKRGKNVLKPLPVPAYVEPADLCTAFPRNESSVAVSSTELQPLRIGHEAISDRQSLTITADSQMRGTAQLCYVFPAEGVRWSAFNECRLPTAEDEGFLSSQVCIVNESQIALEHAQVLVPGSAPSTGPQVFRQAELWHPRTAPHTAVPASRGIRSRAAGADPHPHCYEVPMFGLEDAISLDAGMTKSIALGKWLVDNVNAYHEMQTVFSGSEPITGACLTEKNLWTNVRTSVRIVLKVMPVAGDEPVRLLPGPVRLSHFGEASVTYEEATGWSRDGNAILLFCPSSDLRLRRRQVTFEQIYEGHVCTETIAVEVVNATDGRKEVRILEPLFRSRTFSIVAADAPYNIADDGSIEFQVTLQPREKKAFSYQVKYAAP